MSAGSSLFENESFDLVVYSAVLGHAEDPDATLANMARVPKPGRKIRSLFSQRELARVACRAAVRALADPALARATLACGVPRALGVGFFKAEKTMMIWAREALDRLDPWTHHFPLAGFKRTFRGRFLSRSRRLGGRWLDHKLDEALLIVRLPCSLEQWTVTLLAGLVFGYEK